MNAREISGADIANRIELLLRDAQCQNRGILGALLGAANQGSKRAHRKRLQSLLKKLRREDVFRELRICAEFFDVELEYLLFGRFQIKD